MRFFCSIEFVAVETLSIYIKCVLWEKVKPGVARAKEPNPGSSLDRVRATLANFLRPSPLELILF